ncbi:MAG: phosphoglycerate transporter [Dehalococcoidia bacterium]|nr:phosphoglycerate transporter [Dehalococcoidia bacterium]
MLRIGWFATARGTGSYRLLEATLDAIREGTLEAEIAFVFSNREPGEAEPADRFFDLVRANGIPLVTLSSVRFRREHGGERSRAEEPLPEWRQAYDREVFRLLEPYRWDFGVLAGYMLIFTPEVTTKYPLLNLHPAAPGGPVGVWQEVIRQLIRERAERSGVTIFWAIPEVDAGPPVAYCTYAIRDEVLARMWREAEGLPDGTLEHASLFRVIRERGVARELPLVVETLRAFARGERRFDAGGRVVDAVGREAAALDLTDWVEAAVVSSRYVPASNTEGAS